MIARVSRYALAASLFAAAPQLLAAGDVDKGRSKSSTCSTCHGAAGISSTALTPNLAGQREDYLVKALKDFRSGARKNSMMNMMAGNLSDSDIENLAAYYASLPAAK